jgi:hypothetical protein
MHTHRAAARLAPSPLAAGVWIPHWKPSKRDFWQQYNELGGIQDSEVPGGTGSPAYTAALSVLDSDMAQYVHDNTDDEITHFVFLNAYLEARGGEPVDLEPFRTLPSSQATGAQQMGWRRSRRPPPRRPGRGGITLLRVSPLLSS